MTCKISISIEEANAYDDGTDISVRSSRVLPVVDDLVLGDALLSVLRDVSGHVGGGIAFSLAQAVAGMDDRESADDVVVKFIRAAEDVVAFIGKVRGDCEGATP